MVISWVDDDEFYASGVECERKMQEIANLCTQMNEATGRKVQKRKLCCIVGHGRIIRYKAQKRKWLLKKKR